MEVKEVIEIKTSLEEKLADMMDILESLREDLLSVMKR